MKICSLKLLFLAGLIFSTWLGQPQALATVVVGLTDFNSDNGDYVVVSTNNPTGPWTYDSLRGAWSARDRDDCGPVAFRGSRLNSPVFHVVAAGVTRVTFSHRHSFEADTTRWDGGQLRISVNNGPYVTVPSASFTLNGYNNTVGGAEVPNNELNGQSAFTSQSAGYATPAFITSTATLGTFQAGDSLSIQFLAAWDDCSQGLQPNWEIDSVQLDPPVEYRRTPPNFPDPTQPLDASVVEGRSYTLQVLVAGAPPPTLQWFKDSLAIDGATANIHTIRNMMIADAGQYFLRVSNVLGVLDSRVATITLREDMTPPELVSGVLRRDNTALLTFNEPLSATYGLDPFSATVFPKGGDPVADSLGTALGTVTNGTNVIVTFQSPAAANQEYQLGLKVGVVQDLFENNYQSHLEDEVFKIYPLNRELALFVIDAVPRWKYNSQNINYQSGNPSVFDVAFDDSSWSEGAALLGTETAATPEPIRTPVSNIPVTTYYRTRFNIPPAPARVLALRMRTVVDDGARVFINGTEIFRSPGMTPMPTPLNFGAFAGRTVGDAAYEGPFDLPTSNLVAGTNVMAVALHQPAATSSDNLWGCELIATIDDGIAQPMMRLSINQAGHAILEHDGTGVYLQETAVLRSPSATTVWTTRAGGPHASPYDAGAANGTRFFRLTDAP